MSMSQRKNGYDLKKSKPIKPELIKLKFIKPKLVEFKPIKPCFLA